MSTEARAAYYRKNIDEKFIDEGKHEEALRYLDSETGLSEFDRAAMKTKVIDACIADIGLNSDVKQRCASKRP